MCRVSWVSRDLVRNQNPKPVPSQGDFQALLSFSQVDFTGLLSEKWSVGIENEDGPSTSSGATGAQHGKTSLIYERLFTRGFLTVKGRGRPVAARSNLQKTGSNSEVGYGCTQFESGDRIYVQKQPRLLRASLHRTIHQLQPCEPGPLHSNVTNRPAQTGCWITCSRQDRRTGMQCWLSQLPHPQSGISTSLCLQWKQRSI